MYTKKDKNAIYSFAEFLANVALTGKDYKHVDVYELLKLCGGELVKVDDLEDEAQLIKDSIGLSFKVAVPSVQDEAERRFAIAHELGHAILHYDFPEEKWINCDNINAARNASKIQHSCIDEEKTADYFAEGLLIPKEDFLEQLKNEKVDVSAEDGRTLTLDVIFDKYKSSIIKIADYFKVTPNTIISRGLGVGVFRAF